MCGEKNCLVFRKSYEFQKNNLTKPMHFEMFGCVLTFCKPWARNCQNSRLLETSVCVSGLRMERAGVVVV